MHTFIFDIGKTNLKGVVVSGEGSAVWSRSTVNRSVAGPAYLQFDVDGIWGWLQETLQAASQLFPIAAINVSTHGACAVLLDSNGELAFPVMDYEFEGLEVDDDGYRDLRPPFAQTLSPQLGAGLNLGRQLWWLRQRFPEQFARVARILMYPQFWVWKLTGVAVTEVTSLGCHTDLWEPAAGGYSPLVDALGLAGALPGLVSATTPVGVVSPVVGRTLGLPRDCQVYPGVHDSNASFARHLYAGLQGRFAVVSTGTWIVSMCNGGNLGRLVEARDMLANVSVLGEPIACARFMGGREFEDICGGSKQEGNKAPGAAEIARLVSRNVFALPPFARGSGPFRNCQAGGGSIVGGTGSPALATLYLALMIDYELELLGASGSVVFGSISSKNPLLCSLLAQLRPGQAFLASGDVASTITGAWCLARWNVPAPAAIREFTEIAPADIGGLPAYRQQWRERLPH